MNISLSEGNGIERSEASGPIVFPTQRKVQMGSVGTYKLYNSAKAFGAIVVTLSCLRMLSRTVSPDGTLPADLVGALDTPSDHIVGAIECYFDQGGSPDALSASPGEGPIPFAADQNRGPAERLIPPRADPGRPPGATFILFDAVRRHPRERARRE
jgi:hypothetical protein